MGIESCEYLNMAEETTKPVGFQARKAIGIILSGAVKRCIKIVSGPITQLFALQHLLQHLPGVIAGYLSLNTSDPDYNTFVAGPLAGSPSDESKVEADVNNFVTNGILFSTWVERARQIRLSGKRSECVGNLSVALNVGAAYALGMSSSNTLLSLIPTAGVLIGAPAKELWVLYVLRPNPAVIDRSSAAFRGLILV
jgi:hypothetical protein